MTRAERVEPGELAALRSIVEGTAAESGERFFPALVEHLIRAMGTIGAWVAVYDEPTRTLRGLSMKLRDQWLDDYSYPIDGTAFQAALDEQRMLHTPEPVLALCDAEPSLKPYGAVSCLGVALFDGDGHIIGQLAVFDDQPISEDPRGIAILRIFASRAAAELRRLKRERALREREAQLSRLIDSAIDALVNLDDELAIARVIRRFQDEATRSQYSADQRRWFTLILRDVEERLAAERRIESLVSETESLRDELRALGAFSPILGSSPALLSSLRELERVAATDATVLLLGEIGTGKELFARALHAGSARAHKPLIKVACAAGPANLIERELFGYEKGAFAGATSRHRGRLALAQGGTLFLDEIGELPLELQPKLLRVLQESAFEPVGSSRTVKVDVRIVAATHRDLAARVRDGSFRDDLYRRLNRFPIRIPPLRERGADIAELAQAFVDRLGRRFDRRLPPLSQATLERLAAYSWPGNVRELANVIERGVIVSKGGSLELDRVLLDSAPSPAAAEPPTRILSVFELEDLERANIVRALEASGWKVAGVQGAAARLGMNQSTLNSRLRALGISRPAARHTG